MLDWSSATGAESDPTAVLLHPAGATRHAWTPHVDRLAEDYHLVTVDLPAHGVHPDAEFSYSRAVSDVGEVLDEVGSSTLVGHSLGGYVALRAAAAHGERIDGVLVAGAAYNWRSHQLLALAAAIYPLSYLVEAVGASERLTAWCERWLPSESEAQEPPDHEDTHNTVRGVAHAMRASAYQRTWTYAEAFDGPALIVHGTEESLPDHAGRLAATARWNLRWVDGGHMAPVLAPDEFTPLVAQFLEEVVAGR